MDAIAYGCILLYQTCCMRLQILLSQLALFQAFLQNICCAAKVREYNAAGQHLHLQRYMCHSCRVHFVYAAPDKLYPYNLTTYRYNSVVRVESHPQWPEFFSETCRTLRQNLQFVVGSGLPWLSNTRFLWFRFSAYTL